MKRFWSILILLALLAQAVCLGASAAGQVTGKLERRAGYELASVRYVFADGSYGFAEVRETADGYAYSFADPGMAYTLVPEYFSTTVWDGAVDLSWYDAEQTEFYISTPAQLAGLAALVNGRVDADTPDYRIRGDRSQLVSTRVDDFLLIGAGGGNLYGTVYVGDQDHDFSDKTVYLTADLDMGGECNWTPIGGKYSMDAANSDYVIEAFFNGTLDGQGHRITNLHCDRYAAKGYAYSQAVGLVGYLGELYQDEAAPKAAPAVRNLSVSGDVYGRRMVGGIVGRTGKIPTGVYLENCANHATVRNTDSKGIGGIVGTGWSTGAIVNCYNTGVISTSYACPAGGIVGSNGGLDVFNCYNVGRIDSSGNARGRGIGGHDSGSYTVSDCYYLDGCDDDPASNGWYVGMAQSIRVFVERRSSAAMQTQELVDALNRNGEAYVGTAGGYPRLAWEAGAQRPDTSVRVEKPEGGAISADRTGSVPAGTVLKLSNVPETGWTLRSYILNGKELSGRYATVTGESVLSGRFEALQAGALYIEQHPACELTVTKTGTALQNGALVPVENAPVQDGDALYEGDVLTVKAKLDADAAPDDLNYVYSGGFRYFFAYQDGSGEKATDTGRFTVGSQITAAPLSLRVEPYTTHKVWTQLAETDWYSDGRTEFTLTTARQLAGLAKLVREGNRFTGMTVKLGADISLVNDDKTFNHSVRWWDGIGTNQNPFSGTFDGDGHQITQMTAVSSGSGAALFVAAKSATIRNVSVYGTVEANGSAAGIVASASDTVVERCDNHAEIRSTNVNAGGIAAVLDAGSSLLSCTNRGTVNGTDGVGGVVGVVQDANSSLTDCLNYAAVGADGASIGAGGVAGRIGGALLRCANYGPVSGACWYMGGVAGVAKTQNASRLTDCYSVGDVSNTHSYSAAGTGGLLGHGDFCTLETCFSYAAVAAQSGTADGAIGKYTRRSTNSCKNVWFLGEASEIPGVSGQSAAGFASEDFLNQLNADRCFVLKNGKYPEFSSVYGETVCVHTHTELVNVRQAVCGTPGYSGDLVCTDCGAVLRTGEVTAATCPGASFADMPSVGNWAHAGIDYAVTHGLFKGVSPTSFEPDGSMTRAMLVTVLWRVEGQPDPSEQSRFSDVERGSWYDKAVLWAAECKVVNGVSATRFEPDSNVTREQIAVILYRYARYKGLDTRERSELSAFPDVADVSSYATTALSWANGARLINGTSNGSVDLLDPQGDATRAQVAAILMRFLNR